MLFTLLVASIVGCLLEAEGINTWAKRLPVGQPRDLAMPIAAAWLEWCRPLHSEVPRALTLDAKAHLAAFMLVERTEQTERPHTAAPVLATVLVPIATASAAPLAAPSFEDMEVVLAGDSMMAVGLAPTLKRWMAAQKNMHVTGAYRSGTGLARPEVYDWVVEFPRMLGSVTPSIVIGAMGANDAQNVQVGKTVLHFGTPEWDEFFCARLSAYFDVVTRKRPYLLWIGLPEMRSPVFSQKISHINALQKAVLAHYPNTTWLDPGPFMHDSSNQGFQQFRSHLGGKLEKVRADDGIHLTDAGAAYLLIPIRNWIARALVDGKPAK